MSLEGFYDLVFVNAPIKNFIFEKILSKKKKLQGEVFVEHMTASFEWVNLTFFIPLTLLKRVFIFFAFKASNTMRVESSAQTRSFPSSEKSIEFTFDL